MLPLDLPPAPLDAGPPSTTLVVDNFNALLTQADADAALVALQKAMPNTKLLQAWPAKMPSMVAIRLESGQVAYTDKFGRYFILGLILDSASGVVLDKQLEGQQ